MRAPDTELLGPRIRTTCLNLYNGHANCEEEERHPLGGREFLAEEKDGKGGGGENLHLVGDLERGHRKVADGDKLERVLDDVEQCRYGQLPAVSTKNVVANLSERGGPREDGCEEARKRLAG